MVQQGIPRSEPLSVLGRRSGAPLTLIPQRCILVVDIGIFLSWNLSTYKLAAKVQCSPRHFMRCSPSRHNHGPAGCKYALQFWKTVQGGRVLRCQNIYLPFCRGPRSTTKWVAGLVSVYSVFRNEVCLAAEDCSTAHPRSKTGQQLGGQVGTRLTKHRPLSVRLRSSDCESQESSWGRQSGPEIHLKACSLQGP